MKCYYAPTEDAVGICKACGKGLSFDYAAEMALGLACKNKCEPHVQRLGELVSKNIEMQKPSEILIRKSGVTATASGAFILFLGVVFLFQAIRSEFDNMVSSALGAAFSVYGVVQILRGLALSRSLKK